MIPDVVSKNGIDVCFEEERKRLDDILCHDLELMSLLLRPLQFFLCILVLLCVWMLSLSCVLF